MDADRFDLVVRSFSAANSRRQALAAAIGGSLGLLGLEQIAARRKKRKNKNKKCKKGKKKCGKKCISRSKCCRDGDCGTGQRCVNGSCRCLAGTTCEATCCGDDFPRCCPATTQDPGGLCMLNDDVCCTSDQGGGACPEDAPQCCPITSRYPQGSCGEEGEACCPSEKGGQVCPSEDACCLDNSDCDVPDETCQDGCCAPAVTCDIPEDCDLPIEECIDNVCVSICDGLGCPCACGREVPSGEPACVTLEGECDFPCDEGCPSGWICVDDGGCDYAHCHPACGEAEQAGRSSERTVATRMAANEQHVRRPRSQRTRRR